MNYFFWQNDLRNLRQFLGVKEYNFVKMRFLAPTVLVVTLTWSMGQCSYNIDDSSLYSINFNPSSDDEALLNAPSLLQTVTMTTSHNEKYVCQLPAEVSKEEAKDEEYSVSTRGLSLLRYLFVIWEGWFYFSGPFSPSASGAVICTITVCLSSGALLDL